MIMKVTALSLLLGHVAVAQQPGDDEVLARVGGRVVTVGELRQRIELMPWPGKDNPETRDSAKVAALASLVAEKLLSSEAVERGMVQRPSTSASLAAIERLFARNELYRMEAAERVTIDSVEMMTGLERYAVLLQLNVFVVDSQAHAERLAARLTAAAGSSLVPFEECCVCLDEESPADSPRVPLEGVLSHDTVVVSYGDLHPAYEDAAYSLQQRGEARAAFSERYGWAVFQLLARTTNPNYAKQSIQERLLAVTQKLRKRKEGLLAIEFARRVLSHRLALDSAAFHLLADSLHALLLADSAGHRQEGWYSIRGDDVERLRTGLAPALNRTFARMGDYSIRLEEIVGELKFFPLRFPSLRKGSFLRTFNHDIRLIIEAAIMSQEALRRNLHQRPGVRREMQMWIDAMQSERMLKFLLDSLARGYGAESGASPDSAQAAMRRAAHEVNRYIASLAERQTVRIDFDRLKRVSMTPMPMVTRRFIGFGGAMMAVPMLPQLWDWLEFWMKAEQIQP